MMAELVTRGARRPARHPRRAALPDVAEFGAEVAVLAGRLGLVDRIRFTGHVRDVPAVLPALDVLVCASREEGFGLAVVEAMTVGIPVVSTRCGGPEDVLEHGVTGLLASSEHAVELADAVELLLVDPGVAAALAGFHESERWTPELGLEFMITRTITDPSFVRDEIDRYLGWPDRPRRTSSTSGSGARGGTTRGGGTARRSTWPRSTGPHSNWARWGSTRSRTVALPYRACQGPISGSTGGAGHGAIEDFPTMTTSRGVRQSSLPGWALLTAPLWLLAA